MGVDITGCASIEEPGSVKLWAGSIASVPVGWLFCNGDLVNKSAYPSLWLVLGDIYGASSATQFQLPDYRNVVIAGANEDSAGKPKTNITGALTQTGGSYRTTFTGSAAAGLPITTSLAGLTNVSQSTHTHVVTCTNIAIIPPYSTGTWIIKT